MNKTEALSNIKKLIGEDKLDEAFEVLENIFKTGSQEEDEVIQLKARHRFLRKSENQNVISFYEANLELCKIRVSALDLLKGASINENQIIDIQIEEGINAEIRVENLNAANEKDEFDESDIGYLDYLIDFQENNEEVQKSIENMGSHSKTLTGNMSKRNKQLNNLRKGNQTPNLVLSRKIANALANEMIDYVSRMETEISVFERASKRSMHNAFNILHTLYGEGEINYEELEKLDRSLDALIEAILEMRESSVSAKSGFSEWKKVTKEINRAKRRTEDILDQLYDELSEYLKSLEGFKQNIKFTIIEIKEKEEKL